jgi:hypothetical protein
MGHVTQWVPVPTCHTTQSHPIRPYCIVFVSVLHIGKQLPASFFRNLCPAEGPEDGGSKLLLVITVNITSLVHRLGENTRTGDNFLCSRGYVQSLKKCRMWLDSVE